MWQIFFGSLILSVIHALIPNHWIPLIAISRTEKWTTWETLSATGIAGVSHTLSTIFIGIIVGFFGIQLSEHFNQITRIAAPIILLLLGVIYLFIDLKSSRDHHHIELNDQNLKSRKSKLLIIFSLSVAMFLTPCIEIEAYYFQAATIGWWGIFIVSGVYLMITILFMLVLVYLGLKGVNRFRSHYLDHHEKRITGIFLILLGLFTYLIEL